MCTFSRDTFDGARSGRNLTYGRIIHRFNTGRNFEKTNYFCSINMFEKLPLPLQ